MAKQVRSDEAFRVRMDKSLAERIRAYGAATNRSFSNACEVLLYFAVTEWEQSAQAQAGDS